MNCIGAIPKIAQNNCLNYSDCIEIGEAQFDFQYVRHQTIAEDIVSLVNNKRLFAKASANAEVIDILSDSIAIIAKYPQIFDSISVILDELSSNETKIGKMENMYLYADKEIEDLGDKDAVMNGISTTIHSLGYWDENLTDWQQNLGGNIGKASLGILGAVGIIDGAGAVIGTLEGIRDTYKGQEGRLEIIAGRAIGEAAKTSAYAVLAIIMI